MDPLFDIRVVPKHFVTEPFILEHQLHKLIAPENWKDLARALGFNEADIDRIQIENDNCPTECCIKVLVKWTRRQGQDATLERLAEALIEIGQKDVADKIMGSLNGRGKLYIDIRGTIKVDDVNQIILGNDSAGRSTFFVWETKRKEFHTSLREIKDYIYAIDQITGNTPKERQTKRTLEAEGDLKKTRSSPPERRRRKPLTEVKLKWKKRWSWNIFRRSNPVSYSQLTDMDL